MDRTFLNITETNLPAVDVTPLTSCVPPRPSFDFFHFQPKYTSSTCFPVQQACAQKCGGHRQLMLYLQSISKCMLGSALVRDCLRSASHVLASIKPVSKSSFYLVSYLMCVESLCFQGFCSMVPVRYPSLSFLILLLPLCSFSSNASLSGYIPKPTPSASPELSQPLSFFTLFSFHTHKEFVHGFTLFNYSFEVLEHIFTFSQLPLCSALSNATLTYALIPTLGYTAAALLSSLLASPV